MVVSVFDWDQLPKIRQHSWKEHLKLNEMPNLKVICCKQKHIYNPDVYNSVPILVFFLEPIKI